MYENDSSSTCLGWLLQALTVFSLLGIGAAATAAQDGKAASHVQIRQISKWVEQLGGDSYLVREQASRNLLRAGRAAIPDLAVAADGADLERATRAVRILLRHLHGEDKNLSYEATRAVAELKNRPLERAEARSRLADMREKKAVAEVFKLGAVMAPKGDPQSNVEQDIPPVDGVVRCLKLSAKWQGGNEGLDAVNDLRSLDELSIFNESITDEGLERLRDLPQCSKILICNSRVSAEAAAKLQERLPHARVDFRRGALLGVRNNPVHDNAVIGEVTEGSAAAAAGLEKGDKIVKFNDKPINTFQELTGQIRLCSPGDKATLEIERSGKRITKVVTFGRWK